MPRKLPPQYSIVLNGGLNCVSDSLRLTDHITRMCQDTFFYDEMIQLSGAIGKNDGANRVSDLVRIKNRTARYKSSLVILHHSMDFWSSQKTHTCVAMVLEI